MKESGVKRGGGGGADSANRPERVLEIPCLDRVNGVDIEKDRFKDQEMGELRLRLHEAGCVWNRYEIGTDTPCVYREPVRSALDRFSYPVPDRFTCESDPVWNYTVP